MDVNFDSGLAWKQSISYLNYSDVSLDDVHFANTNYAEFVGLWRSETNTTSNMNSNVSRSAVSSDFPLINALQPYLEFYESIYGYVGLAMGIFGVIANIINIIVLSRRNMTSQINAILTALAVADMMLMLNEILKIVLGNYLADICPYSFGCVVIQLARMNMGVLANFFSVWLTVVLAIWRFMSVCYPVRTQSWRTTVRARVAIASTYVSCFIMYAPYLLILKVQTTKDSKGTKYRVSLNELYRRYLVGFINYWSAMGTVVHMLVPCIVVTVLTVGLIRSMNKVKSRRKTRKRVITSLREGLRKREDGHNRTTKMLIVVLLLFLITNLPRGILLFLNHIMTESILFHSLHSIFDKILTTIILFNSAVNFVVYYSMCMQFRDTFNAIFLKRR